ncbi:MAG: ATP synthase F0 subunit B [Thermodesulfovibrionales bacterium]|nr:ATP synthase F0 subunit B [Thermodesulfovibrionales bacterium]
MLELNKWFFVMAANFFILFFILNYLLFKPLLKIFKEREDTVKNSLDAAKDMTNRREEGIARLNRELVEARNRAKETFETRKAEGLQKQKEILSEAGAEASEILEKARSEIRAEAERARKSLRVEVDKFSDEILRKLVRV